MLKKSEKSFFFYEKYEKIRKTNNNKLKYNTVSSTSLSGGNLVDGLPPASSLKIFKKRQLCDFADVFLKYLKSLQIV